MDDKQTRPVTVQILNKQYKVACPSGEVDILMRSAERVDEEMRQIRDSGKILGTEHIAIMVALNLAHQLLSQQKNSKLSEGGVELQLQLQQLQEKMDSVLRRYQTDPNQENT